ncbi:MAG: hypothetical protein RL088_2244 [Verrucomicrobiota bacterium]|jgi:hypothetical protein
MDFTCIVLFLAIYYLKPQEWTSIFAHIRFVQLTMIAALGTLVFRERSLKARDFFRTPHDWAMLFFFLWICITYHEGPVAGFREFLNRITFYVVIVQTLTNWNRISRFLGWWTFFVWLTAFLAIAGEYFWDPLESRLLTHGIMKDRLVLNLSMVNNPNALGHTIAPVIAMLYFFCIWKRPIFMKQIGLLTYGFPIAAVYLTYSKGAYLACAAVILATLTFGRPKWVQIFIVSIAISSGIGAVYALPRMNELQKTKTDEAIQGRIRAFTYGHQYYNLYPMGIGMGQFVPRVMHDHKYFKASHSTYVQTGSELGKTGMFFFLLILWCNLRTLMFAKTYTVEQERIRRLLFVLVASYMISGWMVDFAYRATFFMFAAAVAAFHRHLHLHHQMQKELADDAKPVFKPWMKDAPASLPAPAAGVFASEGGQTAMVAVLPTVAAPKADPRRPWLRKHETTTEEKPEEPASPPWNKIGVIDIIVVTALMKVVDVMWVYAINHF